MYHMSSPTVLPERRPLFEISVSHALHLLEVCEMGQHLLPIESLG